MTYYHIQKRNIQKSKLAITLDAGIVGRIDTLVRQCVYTNRSQAIAEAVREKLTRLEHSRHVSTVRRSVSPVAGECLSGFLSFQDMYACMKQQVCM